MTDSFTGKASWLSSDGQMMGRVKQGPHKKGVELSIVMPDGTTLRGIYDKVNAKTMIGFCEAVRGQYIEQQAEQKAKKARAAAEREMADDDAAAAADVPDIKETVAFDILNSEDVAARCIDLARREASARDTARACKTERETLTKVVKVLSDAQENSAETPASEERAKAQTETFKELYSGEEE